MRLLVMADREDRTGIECKRGVFRRRWTAPLVVIVLFAASMYMPPAEGFPHLEASTSCDFTEFDLVEVPSPATPATNITDAAEAGMMEWDGLMGPNGSALVRVNLVGSSDVVTVKWIDDDEEPWASVEAGSCNNPNAHVLLNAHFLTDEQRAEDSARHEIGHVLGAHHSGAEDGLGFYPTMATCRLSEIDRDLMLDDRAVVGFHTRSSLTANEGFEEGPSLIDWVATSGSPSVWNFYPAQGTYLVGMPGFSELLQEVNYLDPSSGGRLVQARVQTRTGLQGSNGIAGTMYLYQREGTLLANSPPNYHKCPDKPGRYPGGTSLRWDLGRSNTAQWRYRTAVHMVHSPGWTQTVTGFVDMKVGSYGTGDTQDLKIRIRNRESSYYLMVDNAAIYDVGAG